MRLPFAARFSLLVVASVTIPSVVPSSEVLAQGYPRLAFYGQIERRGFPYFEDDGTVIPWTFDMLARFHEVIMDVDPITPFRPAFLPELRSRNPSIKLLGYVTGHYIWYSADPDSFNHYPTRYWRTVRNLDGFLYNKNGQHFGITNSAWMNVNLAKRNPQGRYVVAESLAAIFYDVVIRKGGWDGIFVDTYCEHCLWAQAPGESIDYQRAGYSNSTAFETAWKVGSDTLASKLRARAGSTRILVGNCEPNTKYSWFNGWMREGFPFQGGGTWYSNMQDNPGGYFIEELLMRTPRNNHISTSIQGGGLIPFSSDNMRRVRLGLGSAALGDGFASFVPGQRDAYVPYYEWWYDEFGVDLGTGRSSPLMQHAGWLGMPLAPYYQMIWVGTGPDAVTNPDVESNLVGWSLYGHPSVGATLTRDTQTAGKGSASIKVHMNNGSLVDWYASLSTTGTLSVNNGQTYSATFWAKASSPRTISVVAAKTTSGEFARSLVTIGTTWKQYQVALVPIGWGTSKLAFYLGLNAGDVWLDDVHFQLGASTIYRRDFQRGIVLVNPSLSVLTVPLGRTYKKINGSNDVVVNNGANVTSVTIFPSDAIFLIDPLSVAGVETGPRGTIELGPPSPNPGRGEGHATVNLRLPAEETVRLELYDAGGRRVTARAPERLSAGPHAVAWDVGPRAPGLYFVRVLTESGARATTKWVVLR